MMTQNKQVQVMLVEDHPSYRMVIQHAIEAAQQIELLSMFGAAEIAIEYLRQAESTSYPDVILLDLKLPGVNGLEAIATFLELAPECKIIVLTQSDSESDIQSAIHAGARGYLLKSSTFSEITQAIEKVCWGGAAIDGEVSGHVLDMIQNKLERERPAVKLSNREMQILQLISQGQLKKNIAEELDLSYGSVATYIRRLYEKLEVQNGAAAVDMAYRLGILELPGKE